MNGWAMRLHLSKYFRVSLITICGVLLPAANSPAKPAPEPDPQSSANQDDAAVLVAKTHNMLISGSINISLKGPNGAPLNDTAVVTISKLNGEYVDRQTTKKGRLSFVEVLPREYIVQVISPKFETTSKHVVVPESGDVTISFEMKALSDAEEAQSSAAFYALAPRTQKEVGKALEALSANKPDQARKHLEAAQKAAPASAEIEYLFGIYASQTHSPAQAMAYYLKTLELDPTHLSALLSVSQDLLQANKSAEALPYLKRAAETAPTSWRAQTLLAEACVLQNMNEEATKHALRAIDLGHDQAAPAQLVLVRVLVQKKEVPQAISKLEEYVKAHPTDKDTASYLEKLKNPPAGSNAGASTGEMSVVSNDEDALPVPSNWLPPDVDSSVPAVEPGVACNVDEVVRKAGQQLTELAKDVDRFTATETLTHQSIDKYGLPSAPERRTSATWHPSRK